MLCSSIPHTVSDPNIDCRQLVSVARFLVSNAIRTTFERQVDIKKWSFEELESLDATVQAVDSKLRAMTARLRSWLAGFRPNLPRDAADLGEIESFRHTSITDWSLLPTEHNSVFLEWASILLQLMTEKTYRVLYQPFQSQDDQTI